MKKKWVYREPKRNASVAKRASEEGRWEMSGDPLRAIARRVNAMAATRQIEMSEQERNAAIGVAAVSAVVIAGIMFFRTKKGDVSSFAYLSAAIKEKGELAGTIESQSAALRLLETTVTKNNEEIQRLTSVETKLRDTTARCETLASHLEKATAESLQFKSQVEQKECANEEMRGAVETSRETADAAKKYSEELLAKTNELHEKIRELERQASSGADSKARADNLEAGAKQLRSELAGLKNELEKERGAVREAHAKTAEVEAKLRDSDDQRNKLEKQNAALTAAAEALARDVENLAELTTNIGLLRAKEVETEKRLTDLSKTAAEAQATAAKLAGVNERNAALVNEIASALERAEKAEKELAEVRLQNTELEGKASMIAEYERLTKEASELMRSAIADGSAAENELIKEQGENARLTEVCKGLEALVLRTSNAANRSFMGSVAQFTELMKVVDHHMKSHSAMARKLADAEVANAGLKADVLVAKGHQRAVEAELARVQGYADELDLQNMQLRTERTKLIEEGRTKGKTETVMLGKVLLDQAQDSKNSTEIALKQQMADKERANRAQIEKLNAQLREEKDSAKRTEKELRVQNDFYAQQGVNLSAQLASATKSIEALGSQIKTLESHALKREQIIKRNKDDLEEREQEILDLSVDVAATSARIGALEGEKLSLSGSLNRDVAQAKENERLAQTKLGVVVREMRKVLDAVKDVTAEVENGVTHSAQYEVQFQQGLFDTRVAQSHVNAQNAIRDAAMRLSAELGSQSQLGDLDKIINDTTNQVVRFAREYVGKGLLVGSITAEAGDQIALATQAAAQSSLHASKLEQHAAQRDSQVVQLSSENASLASQTSHLGSQVASLSSKTGEQEASAATTRKRLADLIMDLLPLEWLKSQAVPKQNPDAGTDLTAFLTEGSIRETIMQNEESALFDLLTRGVRGIMKARDAALIARVKEVCGEHATPPSGSFDMTEDGRARLVTWVERSIRNWKAASQSDGQILPVAKEASKSDAQRPSVAQEEVVHMENTMPAHRVETRKGKRARVEEAASAQGAAPPPDPDFGQMPTLSKSAPCAPSPLEFLAEYIEAQNLVVACFALAARARVAQSFAALAPQSAQFGRVRRARMYI